MAVVDDTRRVSGLRAFGKKLGPAFVLATVVLGPGSLTLHTLAGSLYGKVGPREPVDIDGAERGSARHAAATH